jgi:hypothetical protein
MSLTLVSDNYSPVTEGDTLINFVPQFGQYVSGILQPFDLTDLTITMKMQNANDTSIVQVGAGTWTIDNATQGQAHYVYGAADVAIPGIWNLFIKLTNSISGAFVHTFVKTLEIEAAP